MCSNHFNPIHCILPPHMLDKLKQSEDQKIVELAINSDFRNSRFRSDRNFFQNASIHAKTVLGATLAATASNVMQMAVYDCKQKTTLTGAKQLWDFKTKKKISSLAAKNVIKGGTASWDFYFKLFGRNSIDNKGLKLKHYIHFDKGYDNAYWDGRRMIYGDGDGTIFTNFTSDIDVIGHELTHGVTEHEANLEYENQAGALNESFSDVFGIMIKQRFNNQDVKKANWLIGEKVMKGSKYALRSMKAPGTGYKNHPDLGDDPQPATMDKFVKLPNTSNGDWGGVHINSGIPNFAFYVAAFNIGGFAWEKAGRIWYAALTDGTLSSDAKFTDLKKVTIANAEKLFGVGSLEAKAVKQGWLEAKV
jgi:Zn-dependent metalloprotease